MQKYYIRALITNEKKYFMDWYESWFDSEYYHLLYAGHDFDEAESFITEVLAKLRPQTSDRILDLACGKGRLAISLAERGFDVVGIDLSPESIQHAKQFEGKRLKFYRHDMLKVFRHDYFNMVFNFFTSFGYFDTDDEHVQAIFAVNQNLQSGGCFVLDYLNSTYVAQNLIQNNIVTRNGIKFELNRKLESGYFIKDIRIYDREKILVFQERVRAFDLEDLKLMMEDCGFKNIEVYGDYKLQEYIEEKSPRLILTGTKA